MEFRILGPLEVVDGGRVLDLGGPKQRILLAALLIEANRVVHHERLIGAIWGEQPPATARKALHVHVSHLRKVLGKGRVETAPPGYRLRVEEGELDVERFTSLMEQGAESAALALWRGPALADFAYDDFAQGEASRLEELRLRCLEDRIESDLAEGRHRALNAELDALVRAHPLRERLWVQLVLSLYRSNRQAEALDAYQAARRMLSDELGLEPSRRLQELQQAILNHDPELDLTAEPIGSQPEREPEPPTDGERRTRGERKTVTAVFVATSISSVSGEPLDAERFRRATDRVFTEIEAAVVRHGGLIETTTGDAALAVFGLPRVHEDDAVRALRASCELGSVLANTAEELAEDGGVRLVHRIGVSSGEIVTGAAVGRQGPTGEPMVRCQRLSGIAAESGIVIDELTRKRVRDAVVVEPLGREWSVVTAAGVSSRPERLVSSMVGRDRERRRLHDVFDQAVSDQSCQLFTVLGPAGVGKSRLVREFLADLGGRASIARGRCLPYGEGITFWPVLEVVDELVGINDAETADEARARLVRLMATEQGGEIAARRVASLIGLGEDDQVAAEDGFAAVRRLVELIAQDRPLVLVFDDVHWGEETFIFLVEYLALWCRNAPILLLCLARHELLEARPSWGGGLANATSTLLAPLSGTECAELVANLVGKARLAEEAVSTIATAAEGNPLFAEELFAMLIDEGKLVREADGWSVDGDLSEVRVPPTIQGLLEARLEQLGAHERAAVECAAVMGKVFYEDAVAALVEELPAAAVLSALDSLVLRELIRRDRRSLGSQTYRFRHLLIRDAAYDAVPKETRAHLHERFARWLSRAVSERPTEYEEVIGYHLEQAYRYRAELGVLDDEGRSLGREAAERLGAAGRRAFIRSDAPAGVNLVSRAVRLIPATDPLRVELVPNVRVVQGMGGDMGWADRVLTEAVEAAATTGDRRLAAHALIQRGFLRLFTDAETTSEELLTTADRAIEAFEQLGDERGLARAWRLKAQAHYLGRRAALCVESSERALLHAGRAGDRFEKWELVEWLVIALFLGPTPVSDAVERCERLVEDTVEQPLLQAHVLATLASFAAMQRRTDDADALLDRGRALVDETDQQAWIRSFHTGYVFLWRGDPDSAEREVRPHYEGLKRLGEKSHFTSIAQVLANTLYLQGRYDEAEQLTLESEQASRPNDVHSQILWRSTRAKLLAKRGELGEAARLGREAVSYAAASDFLLARSESLMDLGEVLELAGERLEAVEAIETALRLYEQKGNLVGSHRARTLLGALALTS